MVSVLVAVISQHTMAATFLNVHGNSMKSGYARQNAIHRPSAGRSISNHFP
jgi:hypothetical protein